MTISVLLASVSGVTSKTGDAVRMMPTAAGHHTVSVRVLNFRGRLRIEGSLAEEPDGADWFTVASLDFPRSGVAPETATVGLNFRGRYRWLRAVMDRDHLLSPIASLPSIEALGTLDTVLVAT